VHRELRQIIARDERLALARFHVTPYHPALCGLFQVNVHEADRVEVAFSRPAVTSGLPSPRARRPTHLSEDVDERRNTHVFKTIRHFRGARLHDVTCACLTRKVTSWTLWGGGLIT
jgi:hypothetical protein